MAKDQLKWNPRLSISTKKPHDLTYAYTAIFSPTRASFGQRIISLPTNSAWVVFVSWFETFHKMWCDCNEVNEKRYCNTISNNSNNDNYHDNKTSTIIWLQNISPLSTHESFLHGRNVRKLQLSLIVWRPFPSASVPYLQQYLPSLNA